MSQTFPMSLRSLPNFRGAQGEKGVAALSKLLQNAVSYVSANFITDTLAQVQYARVLNKVCSLIKRIKKSKPKTNIK